MGWWRAGERRSWGVVLVGIVLASLLAGCGNDGSGGYQGEIEIDGSSTVFPISQAVAEEFFLENRGTKFTVGASGTGGGFEKFCRGDIDISDASRPIKPDEAALCAGNGIEYSELTVAADGLSVIVHPDNDWADCLTVEQLRQLWMPGSTVKRWSDLDPSWPDKQIDLYGPGTDSGTFDYFTETINGEAGASRADYSASEDDNTLIQGVEGDRYALAYLGYAYYSENADRLKVLAIDGGNGCVAPSPDTVRDGSYAPLSRPVFIYVNNAGLTANDSPDLETPGPSSTLAAFVIYYLTEGIGVIPFVGYVPYDEAFYEEQLRAIGLR
ncbi:MAG TPA: PstS family phosphate ABC transporter substrate-binding protein [Thermomicrobiales bacterium]|nr:PstS family phosphate ABC transporter substrate-binding protein [Thermomicrobiales bacterium]